MVSVGDKVIVAPMNGQKDNIVVITGPAGQTGGTGGGIVEGDYNTWIHKWTWDVPNGSYSPEYLTFYFDEINDMFYLWWIDTPGKYRFGSYNTGDHSTIFQSEADSHYTSFWPDLDTGIYGIGLDAGPLYFSGMRRSIQTYLLLLRREVDSVLNTVIEVWRAGVKLWAHNIRDEVPHASQYADYGIVTLTGKYIMIHPREGEKIILYEGFDVGTSTTVTETVITDTSKAWTVDNLIGHIVYITSGGANGQEGTITSNTATAITCSAATFITWGMSVGDTYKIS